MKRILVAGIGNIFCGDDGFGCAVIRELSQRSLPAEVEAMDFGIRSYDLAFALTEIYDRIILVDAVPKREAPGTVYLIELDVDQLEKVGQGTLDAHAMNPVQILQLATLFGGVTAELFLVGCEPAILENSEGALGLSESVRQAIPQAVGMIESLLSRPFIQKTPTDAGMVPV